MSGTFLNLRARLTASAFQKPKGLTQAYRILGLFDFRSRSFFHEILGQGVEPTLAMDRVGRTIIV